VAPLLRIELEILHIELRVLNTTFQQRRVPVVGTQGQSDFCFCHEPTVTKI
jgi:hypothetical protein